MGTPCWEDCTGKIYASHEGEACLAPTGVCRGVQGIVSADVKKSEGGAIAPPSIHNPVRRVCPSLNCRAGDARGEGGFGEAEDHVFFEDGGVGADFVFVELVDRGPLVEAAI